MNIAIFTDSFFPQVNGIATHCLELCNGLAQKGHHIQLFIPLIDRNKTTQLHPNIEVHSISGIPLGILKDFRITSPYPFEPIHILKQNIPDVIHFHTSFTLGINGIIAAKKLKIPLVGTFHSYFMEPEYLRVLQLDKVHLDTNTQINSLGWNYAKSIFNKAHIVISPSHFTKNDLVKHGLKKPIKVISNGIDVEKIQNRQLQDISGDYSQQPYFIHVGRLSKEKSLDILITSFAEFLKRKQQVNLVIVGNGPEKEELQTLSEQLGIQKNVYFLGKIENDNLLQTTLLKNALAFVTTSLSEIQPLSILEALCFGAPIIGAAARGVTELIDGNGIAVEPNNIQRFAEAMYTISNDQKLRETYSQKSFTLIQKYTLSKTIAAMEATYSSLLNKSRS